MRRFLPLLLCLLLALPLAACGEDPAADAVPMPTDGGEEAQIQLDPDDPLSNYLDLTQLGRPDRRRGHPGTEPHQ